ncbi:MAG: hypothetical protein ACP5KC_06935, partial [Infirmifilum sp.]
IASMLSSAFLWSGRMSAYALKGAIRVQDLGPRNKRCINICLDIAHKTGYSPLTPSEIKAFVSTRSGVITRREEGQDTPIGIQKITL